MSHTRDPKETALPYAAHVTMPQAQTRGGTVFHVAQHLARAHQRLGGRAVVVTPGAMPVEGVEQLAVDYGTVRWSSQAERRRDILHGSLLRERPVFAGVYDPAIERLMDDPPDLVLLYEGHFACASLPHWDRLRRRGTEIVHYVHNPLPRSCPPWELRRLLRHADRVVFVSEATRDATMRRLGPRHGVTTEVIHNGLAEEFRAPAPRPARPPGDPVVTFFGKVHLTKGPHLAVQAADLARTETGLPVRVRVIGDSSYGHGGRTPYETWLREQAETIATPVEFVPFQDRGDLARHLAESAVVCLPSLAETFGLVAAEAMAAGVPVVCSDLPALREVGGGAAVHVPREDIAAMAGAIADLLEDPAHWAAASAAGWHRAQAFTWEGTARALARV